MLTRAIAIRFKWGILLSGILALTLFIKARQVDPLTLWPDLASGERVYEVRLQRPVGYLRLQQRPQSLQAQIHLKLGAHDRVVEQQFELTVISREAESILENPSTPYTIFWRQLTGEQREWWDRDSYQRSQGQISVVFNADPVKGANQDQAPWCIWYKPTQSLSITRQDQLAHNPLTSYDLTSPQLHQAAQVDITRDFKRARCMSSRPLPESVWPWLVERPSREHPDTKGISPSMSKGEDVASRAGVKHRLVTFSALNHHVQNLVVSQTSLPTLNTLNPHAHTTTPTARSSLHFKRDLTRDLTRDSTEHWLISSDHTDGELLWNHDRLIHWRSAKGEVTWTLSASPWSGWDEVSLNPSAAPLISREIRIQGRAPWRTARWVSLRLNSPVMPLRSERQEVSPDRMEDTSSSRRAQRGYHLLLKRQTTTRSEKDTQEAYQLPSLDQIPITRRAYYGELYQLLSAHQNTQHKISVAVILKEVTRWVGETISFQPHAGLPDPELALRRGRGDCNERSSVLAMVLNDLKLEAKQVFGLLWITGERWGFHAWVSVRTTAGWVELDPQTPDRSVGPEHLAITMGEREAQAELSLLIGNVNGQVLGWSR